MDDKERGDRLHFMSVVPFSAAPGSDEAGGGQIDAGDARERMLLLKQKLDEALGDIESIRGSLAAQQQLEQLLVQGRTHLHDMRGRLQQTASERDAVQAELAATRKTHQHEIDQFQRQIDDVREELQQAARERDRLAVQLAEQEASHKRFAEERTDERDTFKRLLDEASSNQREMMQDLDEQRQQIDTLREAAMRAQNFAREIMRAHDSATAPKPKPPQV